MNEHEFMEFLDIMSTSLEHSYAEVKRTLSACVGCWYRLNDDQKHDFTMSCLLDIQNRDRDQEAKITIH